MYLSKLNLYNFRKFKSINEQPGLTVDFNKNLNIIVGENDSGKTAIIDSIRYLLGSASEDYEKITIEDFFSVGNNEFVKYFEIEAIFSDLNEHEAGLFLEWLSFDEHNEYELRVVLKVERKVSENGKEYFERKTLAGDKFCELRFNSQAREVLKTTYLKPLRDANTELKPGIKSRLANILKAHSLFKGDESNELIVAMEEANNKVEEYFKKDYKEGRSLVKDLENILEDFYDNKDINKTKAKFSISRGDLTSILRKLSLNNEEINLGLGNQNLLFIATELLLLNEFSNGENVVGPNMTLIEEIEAHLHTQAQIRLIKYLENELEKGDFSRQFILTTHSTDLVSSINPRSIIMIHNNVCYPMNEKYTCLENQDYKFLERFLDATKCNLFFAKGIIFVEGESEMLLVPTIAELIGLPLHKHGISVVNVHGTSFERYIRLFSRSTEWIEDLNKSAINIPISIITDLDVKPYVYYDEESSKSVFSIKTQERFIELLKIINNEPEEIQFDDIEKEYSTFNKLVKELGIKYNEDKKGVLEGFLKIDISEEFIEQEMVDKKNKLNAKFDAYNSNHKLFIAPEWTLEYSLAKSCLVEDLYKAIHMVRYKAPLKGNNKKHLDRNIEMLETLDYIEDSIAFEIFKPIFKKNVSKAEVAQELSYKLLDTLIEDSGESSIETKQILLDDHYLDYLISAILHVTGETKESLMAIHQQVEGVAI